MATITTQIQDLENQTTKSISGVLSVSASTTIATTDAVSTVLVTTGNTNRTITLPAVAANTGRRLFIKKVDSGTGTVTITPNGGTIDGASTNVINAQYSFVSIVSDGSNWSVLQAEDYLLQGAGLTTPTPNGGYQIIRTMSIPPGSWDVWGMVVGSITLASAITAIINTTGDGSIGFDESENSYAQIALGAAAPGQITVTANRVYNLTSTTTVYLVGSTNASNSWSNRANLRARRRR